MRSMNKYKSNNRFSQFYSSIILVICAICTSEVQGDDFNVNQWIEHTRYQNVYPPMRNSYYCGFPNVIDGYFQNSNFFSQTITLPPHYQRHLRYEIVDIRLVGMALRHSKIVSITPLGGTLSISQTTFLFQTQNSVSIFKCGMGALQIYFMKLMSLFQANIYGTSIVLTIDPNGTGYSGDISLMQLNVDTCHPSCLTCSGPNISDCVTCSNYLGTLCICPGTQVLHQGQCISVCPPQYILVGNICVFVKNCSTGDSLGNCTLCSSPFLLWQGKCVTTCPAGFSPSGTNCSDDDLFNNGNPSYIRAFFWQDDFSDIEIIHQGFTLSSQQGPNITRCREFQLLGGFLTNLSGSIISFPLFTVSSNVVFLIFRYILIDYNVSNGLNTNIIVSINGVPQNIIISPTAFKGNICGQSTSEVVGIFSTYQNIGISTTLAISITNNNAHSISIPTNPNNHSFFGIREISVFGYNCLVQNCYTCAGNICTKCDANFYLDSFQNCVSCANPGQYINGIYCSLCDVSCYSCTGAANQCDICSNFYIFMYHPSKICAICNDLMYYNPSSQSCMNCQEKCMLCSDVQKNYVLISPTTTPYLSTDLCKVCSCQQCLPPNILYNGQCLYSCSQIGQDFVFDTVINSCKCRTGFNYILISNFSKQCSNSVPFGYFCDINNICTQCVPQCQTCVSSSSCGQCIAKYYLWKGYCFQDCLPTLNIIANNNLGICESKLGCTFKRRDAIEKQLDQQFGNQEYACYDPLVLISFQVINSLTNGSQNQFLPNNYLNNYLIFTYNRHILNEEFITLSFILHASQPSVVLQYKIIRQWSDNNVILAEVEVDQNCVISKITINLDFKTEIITFYKTILVSKAYSSSNESIGMFQTMNDISQSLTSYDGFAYYLIYQPKQFQILCKFSNFVQILPQLYLISNTLPSIVKYGFILGSAFVFNHIPSPQQIAFSSKQISNNNTARNLQDSSDSDNYQVSLCSRLPLFGLHPDFFNNFLQLHILNLVCFIILTVLFIGRASHKEKQYTILINDKISNFLISFLQGSITVLIFTTFLTFQCGYITVLFVFYLLIYLSFYIYFIILAFVRSSDYIRLNIANIYEDINYQAKVAKTYFIVSFLKKHTVIILHIVLINQPIPCVILISIIFFCNMVYILYFRFFHLIFFTILKGVQELFISALYAFLAYTFLKYDQILSKSTITDSDLNLVISLGNIIMLQTLICLIMSLGIFSIRIIFLIINYLENRKKQKLQKLEAILNSTVNLQLVPIEDKKIQVFFSKNIYDEHESRSNLQYQTDI